MIEEKSEVIIGKSLQLFMRNGIKSMTMDDVAKNLGISKKTLYKFVQDKNDLVLKAMSLSCKEEEQEINAICSQGLNAIDESFEISKFIVGKLQLVHPSIHYDLAKYYGNAFQRFAEHKGNFIYNCLKRNMEMGVKEKLYRNDINADVIAKIYTARLDMVFDGQIFPPESYKFPEVYLEMFRYHIRGIASEKGIKYLVDKVKKEKSAMS